MYRKYNWIIVCSVIIFAIFIEPMQLFASGGSPDGTQSSLVATTPGSDTAPANGSSTTSMTLTLKDSGGAVLSGLVEVLSIPSNPSAVINPASATTDSNGQAVFTITSTNPGTFNINVTDQGTQITLTDLGQVTFTAVASSGSSSSNNSSATPPCNQQAPLNAPNLYQVNVQNTKATLFWAPPNDTFDGYTILYGLNANTDNYSVTFPMGMTTGAVSYQINALTAKAPYYFKVRANNGCATGPWSTVKGANISLSKLPATGPSPILMSVGLTGAALFLTGMFFLIF